MAKTVNFVLKNGVREFNTDTGKKLKVRIVCPCGCRMFFACYPREYTMSMKCVKCGLIYDVVEG